MRYLFFLLTFLMTLSAAYAGTPSQIPASVPIPSTFEALRESAVRAKATWCRTDDCKAMILLDYLVQNVGLYLSNDANGAASVLVPHGRTIRADMRIQNKLLNHRELYAPFCAFIVNYLSGINKQTGSNETAYASFVPAQIALSAVDMDIHDGGHCAQQITPFFASRPDDRDYAFSLCIGGYENPHRPQSACNVIKENVKPEEKTVRP